MRTRTLLSWLILVVLAGGLLALGSVSCFGAVDPDANKQLRGKLGNTSVTVFPVVVRAGDQMSYDSEAAGAIARAMSAQQLATTRPSDAHVTLTGAWHVNESEMYRQSAASFTDYIKQHPIQSDYAFLAEYLTGGSGRVLGVHVYVVDKEGRLAGGYGLNSHQPAFRDADPKTVEDCTQLVVRTMAVELRKTRRS